METSKNTKVCSCCGRERMKKKQGTTPRLLLLETRLAEIERKMKKDAEKMDFVAYMQDQRDYAQCQQAITFATQPKKKCDVVEYFTPIKTK